jgi:hypothetical protein
MSPPEEMIATFGDWVQDPDTLRTIRAALQTGRPVLVPSAYQPQVFEALRAEFTAAEYIRSELASTKEKMQKLGTKPFFHSSNVCHAVHAMNGGMLLLQRAGKFFFSHQVPTSYDTFSETQRVSAMLASPEVNRWISWLLGMEEEESIGSATFGVRRFDQGDAYGAHNDDTDGRIGGLSLTSYVTAPDEAWAANANANSWGGNFVWCADTANPEFIAPSANTLLLFRVEDTSWHHVQPLMPGAPPRYVFQGWWRLTPEAATAFRSSYASAHTQKDADAPRDHSLVVLEEPAAEAEPTTTTLEEKSCDAAAD